MRFSRKGAGLHHEARFSRSNGEADWYDRFISPHKSSANGALNCDIRQSALPGCHAEGELIAAPLLADSARLTYSTKMISKMTLATPKDSSPVDVTRFHQVLGNTKEEYSEILAEYFNQMNDSLQRLDAAVSTCDHREVEMISHRCVGTSATCGMTAVVAPLRELESAGRSGCLHDARSLFEKVNAGFEIICAFLNDYCPRPA